MDARTQEFLVYLQEGGQAEATDWLPDEYRQKLVKFIEMHANSELMAKRLRQRELDSSRRRRCSGSSR